jgi:uncharacterized membrane protein
MMGSWYLQPVLGSYLLACLLAMGLIALLRLHPTFGKLTARRQRILMGIRGAVILLMIFALLRPTLILTSSMAQSASIVVLFDNSRSMLLPHVTADTTRWEAQRGALQAATPGLMDLQRQFEVKVYGFDRELQGVELQGSQLSLPEQPEGNETDIGGSIDAALRRELGKRLGAVIVLGDGVQTAFDPSVEMHQAGRELARMGTPLYTVPFGPPGDAAQSRDVAVENLPEQYSGFVKNELTVRGVVRVQGYVNQQIPVELVVVDPEGESRVLGPREIIARQDGQQVPVEFSVTPELPGNYRLTLRVPEQAGELVTTNNDLTSFLSVRDGGLKVAYLYGNLVGEQRYLRWSLASSPDIDLQHLFLDARNRQRWPDDRGDIFRDPSYDLFMIENVDATAFRQEDLRALAQAVEQGKGLIMLGGYHSFGPGGYYSTELRDILPVEMGRFERQELDPLGPISIDLHLEPEQGLPLVPVRPHPITRLGLPEENEEAWKRLPPLRGANRLRVKDAAQVLLESTTGDPMLVAGEYGQGRTLAFGGDSTRLWWQYGRESEHKRFWRQVVLWLAQRDEDPQGDVWIKLAHRRFHPRMPVSFTAGARTSTGDALTGIDLEGVVRGPDGVQQKVTLSPREDEFQGELRELQQPGDYTLEVTAGTSEEPLGSAQVIFQILDRDLELSIPAADPGQMARLAALTKVAGGRLVAAEELPQLLEELKQRLPEQRLDTQTRWRLGDTAADAWAFFLLFVGLLGTEWLLRKRWGMV